MVRRKTTALNLEESINKKMKGGTEKILVGADPDSTINSNNLVVEGVDISIGEEEHQEAASQREAMNASHTAKAALTAGDPRSNELMGKNEGMDSLRDVEEEENFVDEDIEEDHAEELEQDIDYIKYILKLLDKKRLKELAEMKKSIPNAVRRLKRITKEKERQGEEIIEILHKENKKLTNRVVKLTDRNAELKNEIRSLKNQMKMDDIRFNKLTKYTQESESINHLIMSTTPNLGKYQSQVIKLDIYELLTGATIKDLNEDKNHIIVNLKQSGKTVEFHYILRIEKKDPSQESEVLFEPILNEKPSGFVGDWDENTATLKKLLPSYLVTECAFPYHTITLFYNKINESINA